MSSAKSLREQVEENILARRLLVRGEGVLVAVSGGMDSMVLLHLLHGLSESHGWRLVVAHFNHLLRGRSSDADERLAKRTARKLGLDFIASRADVRKFAGAKKISIEMAARKLRHEFLARAARERGIRRVALAHHADDQVELFFVRLLRGAGSEGLAGMKWMGASPADSRLKLVRPLLDQPKAALSGYAKLERIAFREDASNANVDIQRNRIRHELLPLLARRYQPALGRVVLRGMEVIGAESQFVTEAARRWLKGRAAAFETLAVAVQRRCVELQLTEAGIAASFDLVENLRLTARRVFAVSEGKSVSRNEMGRIEARPVRESRFGESCKMFRLNGLTGKMALGAMRCVWVIAAMRDGTFRAPKRIVNCEHFDADKVGRTIVIRHWRAGDRFQPIGMTAAVKLQDLFTNLKIAREERHGLMVATTSKGEVFWVEQLRIGECFKLDKNTRYQLKWQWKRL